MGGMGRAFDGSYAEYTCVPANQVIPVDTALSWTSLAAIPETYLTAWGCLHAHPVAAGCAAEEGSGNDAESPQAQGNSHPL